MTKTPARTAKVTTKLTEKLSAKAKIGNSAATRGITSSSDVMAARVAQTERPPLSLVKADATYDPNCTRCPRLASFLAESHAKYPTYWCRPVPSFGAKAPAIVLIGLAPGLHGANRTARPFTGDYAGLLLYETLHKLGLATQPTSVSAEDPLKLVNVRIVNAVKCVPPENKPLPDEIARCNEFMKAELARLTSARVYVALGRIAHDALLGALGLKRAKFQFGHGTEHVLDETRHLVDSYHCSRYNTQTRRLTPEMFQAVLKRACELAEVG
jgi:uracil-DNA glycosylase